MNRILLISFVFFMPAVAVSQDSSLRILFLGDQENHNPEMRFNSLIERGIRWACGEGAVLVSGNSKEESLARMKQPASDLEPFNYTDVGPEIPNYAAGGGKTLSSMQQPAAATESMNHIVTPEGFQVELFADESMLNGKMFGGKPIAMNWDEQGRLWVCETVDYPNELKDRNKGRDRIRILADTDGDGKADRSTVFAENLSIPTAIAFHRSGAVVQNGTETLYLKDTNNDGKADVRQVLISNWTLIDTHGGVSSFRYGLDNWFYAMQGYNDSSPVINGVEQPKFRMGFFRFQLSQDELPRVEQLEFLRSTTNNTWGIGISEEGLLFGSTANRQPSFFMPIPNRYYERVKGWAPERLTMICDDHLFDPITDRVRQVDHHGGYTAAAGHALYTARNYPEAWWNRTAFVCGPTGKLVGAFVIERDGAGMKSDSSINLFASDDEWTAPIMAEVGPDGNVWVLDWYNYIVQHNPTPHGFETGKGRAYETKLRDKKYGRVYRIVPKVDDSQGSQSEYNSPEGIRLREPDLRLDLKNPTMQVRLSAQRLLIERGDDAIVSDLLQLIQDRSIDNIGLNVGAIHALHTLDGLGQLNSDSGEVFEAVVTALSHPSAGVRLNAIRVLPETFESFEAIKRAKLMRDVDYQVVLAVLLKVADTKNIDAGAFLGRAFVQPKVFNDRWLLDALTSAGSVHAESCLPALMKIEQEIPETSLSVLARIAEHFARSEPSPQSLQTLVAALAASKNNGGSAVIAGLSNGWPEGYSVEISEANAEHLRKIFVGASESDQVSLVRLATSWSIHALEKEIDEVVSGLINRIHDNHLSVAVRLTAANSLMELDPERVSSVEAIQAIVGPRMPSSLSGGLVRAIGRAKVKGLGERLLEIIESATPVLRENVIQVLLSRPALTMDLLDGIKSGKIQTTDLSTGQRGFLKSHPSVGIRRLAVTLLRKKNSVDNSNRAQLVREKRPLTKKKGDPEIGRTIFTKNCASCHVFKGEGQTVGPNLNGMSVHPKSELLIHILDPNQSVEANFRSYTVLTTDGLLIGGLLSTESLTTIEIIDSQGKAHTILREDIEDLKSSTKSAMPEGFEDSINDDELVSLLEYLTQAERFVPLRLAMVANVTTTEGMFYNRENDRERLVLSNWGTQTVEEIPFSLIDPRIGKTRNAVMLHSELGPFAPKLPKSVSIPCRTAAEKIHILGGVAGWAAKKAGNQGVSMIVRLKYTDGQTEDYPLVDGQHIADYIGQFDVPKSKLAFKTEDGGQVRYLSIKPSTGAVIETIELVKVDHKTAPIVLGITVEVSLAEPGA